MRTSIRQVAERANVSAMTVSRVLRGRDSLVQKETRRRVVAAMRELDYIPVRQAAQNRHIETFAIGLVPYYRPSNPTIGEHDIDAFTYQGVLPQAYKHDYDLLVMLRDEAAWMADRRDARFLDRRCDGFIFISPGVGEWRGTLETLVEHNIPTVVCYQRAPIEGVAWVDPDNEAIIHQSIDCLLRNGHRQIAYLAGPVTTTSQKPRLVQSGGERNYDDLMRSACFQQLMGDLKDSGVVSHVFQRVNDDWRLDAGVLADILDAGVTGVLCVDDLVAIQLWTIAENAGLSIPKSFSIIGVDDVPSAAARHLTTVRFRYEDIGRLAVDALVALCQGSPVESANQVVPVRLIERGSVSNLEVIS